MRNVHLLTGNLTRTACGHSVWSIYPHESEGRSGTLILIRELITAGEGFLYEAPDHFGSGWIVRLTLAQCVKGSQEIQGYPHLEYAVLHQWFTCPAWTANWTFGFFCHCNLT
jgi:hypothetical protein